MNIAKILDQTATVAPASGIAPATPAQIACAVAPADWRTVMAYAQHGINCVNLIYSADDLGAAAGDHVSVGGKTYTVVAVQSYSNARFDTRLYVTACGAAT